MQAAVIINESAGCGIGKPLISKLRRYAAGAGAQWLTARSRAETSLAAAEAVAKGIDVVIAAGGDGTVNAVGERLIGTRSALGIIPLGSANDLARECDIPQDPREAFETALSGTPKRIDVIRVNGRHFITCGGIGLPSAVIAETDERRVRSRVSRMLGRFDGSLWYQAVAARRLLLGVDHELTIELLVDGRSIALRTYALILANQRRFGRRFIIAPAADNADGIFNVCALGGSGSRLRLMRNVGNTFRGAHELMKGVAVFRTKHAQLRCESAVDFFGDGELLLNDSSFEVAVIPSALSVICPVRQGVGEEPRHTVMVSSCRQTHSC